MLYYVYTYRFEEKTEEYATLANVEVYYSI